MQAQKFELQQPTGLFRRKPATHVTEITLDHLRPSPQWKRAFLAPAWHLLCWPGRLQRMCHAGDGNGGIQVQGKVVPDSLPSKWIAGALL